MDGLERAILFEMGAQSRVDPSRSLIAEHAASIAPVPFEEETLDHYVVGVETATGKPTLKPRKSGQ